MGTAIMRSGRKTCPLCRKPWTPADVVTVTDTSDTVKPGWCGGPRQGSYTHTVHTACADAAHVEAVASWDRAETERIAEYVEMCTEFGRTPKPALITPKPYPHPKP